jgi:hypothetical protein
MPSTLTSLLNPSEILHFSGHDTLLGQTSRSQQNLLSSLRYHSVMNLDLALVIVRLLVFLTIFEVTLNATASSNTEPLPQTFEVTPNNTASGIVGPLPLSLLAN